MKKKVVIAVSGGADSMCLLHYAKDMYDVIVAHVNYGLRENAFKESALVKSICKKYQLPFEVLYVEKKLQGNFQQAARELRYQFFASVCEKYQCNTVLTAHHFNDVLETFLMQKNRGSVPSVYGIPKVNRYANILIERPLLQWKKKEILEYCEKNSIAYLDDESNFSLKYERNRVRKSLQQYSDAQLELLCEELVMKNQKVDKYEIIRTMLFEKGIYHFSDKSLENIKIFLKKGKGTFILSNRFHLYPNGIITEINRNYEYTFSQIDTFKCDYFSISKTGDVGGFYVHENEFPITIRNFRPSDKIQLRFGTKKIARFFVDKKIPLHERSVWPIVLNCRDEIIFVPKLGAEKNRLNDKFNVFVVK